jgi:hypothetical protein
VFCQIRSNVHLTTALNTIDAGYILLDFPAVVSRYDRLGGKNQGRTPELIKLLIFSRQLFWRCTFPLAAQHYFKSSQKWRTTQIISMSFFLLTYPISLLWGVVAIAKSHFDIAIISWTGECMVSSH